MLIVNEIFRSIQGESTYAGLPCTFIRLTGCNLRCSYCDTQYALYEGKEMTIEDIILETKKLNSPKTDIIEVTGGEPLLQKNVFPLLKRLLDLGYRVLVETNGSLDISMLDRRSVVIMDLKTPKSDMMNRMDFSNLERLTSRDELKFVISDREDYEWSKEILSRNKLSCSMHFSPAYERLDPEKLSEWILKDDLPVRLNLQLHKLIWRDKTVHR